MLPFDILTADNHVYSFEPTSILTHRERFSKGIPQNDWEHALVYVQEHDAPHALPSLCSIPEHTLILRYCAAHVLLEKRAHLLNPARVDSWYVLLDDRPAFSTFHAPDFSLHCLGRLRMLYGIEWLHARAMRYTPLQHAWFAGHYWPTLWSASTPTEPSKTKAHAHNIERWSFLHDKWHIQHWVCEKERDTTHSTPYSRYTNRVASNVAIQHALNRTLLLQNNVRLRAWNSIPPNLRAISLLDWTLADPSKDHLVLSYLCSQLKTTVDNLAAHLEMSRTLQSSGATILQSLINGREMWALPQD